VAPVPPLPSFPHPSAGLHGRGGLEGPHQARDRGPSHPSLRRPHRHRTGRKGDGALGHRALPLAAAAAVCICTYFQSGGQPLPPRYIPAHFGGLPFTVHARANTTSVRGDDRACARGCYFTLGMRGRTRASPVTQHIHLKQPTVHPIHAKHSKKGRERTGHENARLDCDQLRLTHAAPSFPSMLRSARKLYKYVLLLPALSPVHSFSPQPTPPFLPYIGARKFSCPL